MTDDKKSTTTTKPAATAAASKPKYDPKDQYVAKKRIHHKGLNRFIDPGQTNEDGTPFTFDMSHRTPDEVEYLVDEIKAIAPA